MTEARNERLRFPREKVLTLTGASSGIGEMTPDTLRGTRAQAEEQAPHFLPLLDAAERGLSLLLIPQGAWFNPPKPALALPAVVVIGDDPPPPRWAVGPEGFHLPALRKLFRAASRWAIISAAAVPGVYAEAPRAARADRRPVLLVETDLRHEQPWLAFAEKYAPRAGKLLVTVRPEGSA